MSFSVYDQAYMSVTHLMRLTDRELLIRDVYCYVFAYLNRPTLKLINGICICRCFYEAVMFYELRTRAVRY